MDNKKIYVVLTKTTTTFSNIINLITKDEYTHASIAFDENLNDMYSFGRIFALNPFWGGFVKESLNKGLFKYQNYLKGAVYEIEVSDEQYFNSLEMVGKFNKRKWRYIYNYLGVISHLIDIPFTFNHSFLCSEFVYYILNSSEIVDLEKSRVMVKPQDFTKIKAKEIYKGDLKAYYVEDGLPQLAIL